MEASHIQNCINLLERYHDALLAQGYSAIAGLRGEMAIEAAENAMAHIERSGFEDVAEEFIFAFNQELERRSERRLR